MLNYSVYHTEMTLMYATVSYIYVQLLEELKKVTIIDDDKEIKFDSKGDMSSGYDVLLWKEVDGHMEITTMAEYDPENGYFIFEDEEKKKEFLDLKVTFILLTKHLKFISYVSFFLWCLQLKCV